MQEIAWRKRHVGKKIPQMQTVQIKASNSLSSLISGLFLRQIVEGLTY